MKKKNGLDEIQESRKKKKEKKHAITDFGHLHNNQNDNWIEKSQIN